MIPTKKWFYLFLALPLLLASCSKDDVNKCQYSDSNVTATTSETTYLQTYLTNNAIIATQHSSGVFYSIDTQGTGATPSVCSSISVKYTGSLLSNGYVFDSNNNAGFVLGQLIVGWQKGLSVLKSGGSITLYIPPSLGYGNQDRLDNYGNIAIPANSYLKFSIQLMDVQ